MPEKNEAKVEVKENISQIPKVVNVADYADEMSVTSVGPLEESVDIPEKTAEEEAAEASETEEEEEKKESPEKPPAEEKKETPSEPKVKDPVQRRIDEITKARRTAERESAHLQEKLREAETKIKELEKGIPSKDEPKLDDFETEAEYLKALARYEIRQEMEKTAKESAEKQEEAAVLEIYEKIEEQKDIGRKKHEDFDEVALSEDLRITGEMLEAIVFSEVGEEIMYYLGTHPEEADRISSLKTPRQIAFEIGKIEGVVTSPPPIPKKKLTKAPEPITPVKTTGATQKRLEDLPPKEYRAARESGRIS